MIRNFNELHEAVKAGTPTQIAIVGGDNDDCIEFAHMAYKEKLASCIFLGDEAAIEKAFAEHGRPEGATIHVCPADESEASHEAVRLCNEGKAHFILKGKIKTNTLLKAVLQVIHEEVKNGDRRLSHITVLENPRMNKLLILTDAGMNVAPGINEKIQIMQNAIKVAHSLGIEKPKIIFAAGMEDTGQDFPAISDAREIVKRHKAGEWQDAIIDGPFGVDVGLEPDAAKEKKIDTPVAGDTDIIMVPTLEAGNISIKMVLYYQMTIMLGVVVGGAAPILLVSRAHPPRAKLMSAALAKIIVGD
jgi:phosphate butyryltransferase